MNCHDRSVREDLPEYLVSRLSPERTRFIREHLKSCSECRRDLALMEYMVNEPVPEPPTGFWNSLPGRVTSSIREERQRPYRLSFPAWAGGLAAAALLIIIVMFPWKGARMEVKIPEAYYAQVSGQPRLGLEEEILAASGLNAADLDRSLEQEMLLAADLFDDETLESAGLPGLYEGMNDVTLRAFEKLIDDISPVS